MDSDEELKHRNYSKFFSLKDPSVGEYQNENQPTLTEITQPSTTVANYIDLPSDFAPRDMAYHEIGEKTVLIGICGGKSVLFAARQKPSSQAFLMPQIFELDFGKKNYEESLLVIKSGFLYTSEKGSIKIKEIFVTAGRSGIIYIFSLNVDEAEMIKMNHFEAHLNQINDLAFANPLEKSYFRNLLVTGSNDGSCVIWDILSQQALIRIFPDKLPVDEVLAIDWSETRNEIITSCLDAVRIWELDKEAILFLKSRNQKDKSQNFEARRLKTSAIKLKNFHQFYIDFVKGLPNGAIITKSIDGEMMVWSYEKDDHEKDATVILFSKYYTISTMDISDQIGYGLVRPQVMGVDNLVLLPQGGNQKVKVHYMANTHDIKAYTEFHLRSQSLMGANMSIIKALVPELLMDCVFILTKNGKLWFADIKRLDESLNKQNSESVDGTIVPE